MPPDCSARLWSLLYDYQDLESLRNDGDLWEYPNDEGVDLVAFRTLVYDNTKFLPFPVDLIASKDIFTQEHIEVSDRVMIPCLMQNYPGITQNYPIFRDGSIALITEESIPLKWKMGSRIIDTKQRLIFINSTMNEGFSGAPVLLWPGMKLTQGRPTFGGKPWLIGVVHGFFPQRREVIDAEDEPVFLKKPSKEPPNFPGQAKPPRNVPVLSQENSATGIIFPSWQLLDILQSDSVKKRVQQITDEENKSGQQDKEN
jgi:hypothetical protein